MEPHELPLTGTCDVGTIGRRSGGVRRTEIWYVVIDGQIVLTGIPGPRSWLANLRHHPEALVHLRDPARDLAVLARELTDQAQHRRVAEEAGRLQPWYADQPYSIDDWVADSPMVVLDPDPAPWPEARHASTMFTGGVSTSQGRHPGAPGNAGTRRLRRDEHRRRSHSAAQGSARRSWQGSGFRMAAPCASFGTGRG
jgi:deazaflavin-dependent oxidoreductase (nitroreductase family)